MLYGKYMGVIAMMLGSCFDVVRRSCFLVNIRLPGTSTN